MPYIGRDDGDVFPGLLGHYNVWSSIGTGMGSIMYRCGESEHGCQSRGYER